MLHPHRGKHRLHVLSFVAAEMIEKQMTRRIDRQKYQPCHMGCVGMRLRALVSP